MKHLLLLPVLCLLWVFPVRGQGFIAGGGITYQQSTFEPGLLNDLLTSFNAYFENSGLTTPFTPFDGQMQGVTYNIILGVRSQGIYGALQMGRTTMTQQRTASFANGYARELTFEMRDLYGLVDFGVAIKKRLDIGLSLGSGIRHAEMISAQIYPDGTRSVGHEYYFNGIYNNQELVWHYGAVVNVHFLKFITVQGRLFRSALGPGSTPTEQAYLIAMDDIDGNKYPFAEYLPKDYARFVENAQDQVYDFENNVIPAQFPGWNLQLSLLLTIGK